MKAKIRFDWQATREGIRGGLGGRFGQRTEFSEQIEGEWDEMKAAARKIAESKFKPVHQFDGEYLSGIVLVEDIRPDGSWRTCAFINPYA